jgi:hypothetical protein
VLFAPVGLMSRWLAVFGLTVLAHTAVAQTSAPPPAGLPPPDARSEASLHAALAELDRSADTVVAEIGPHTVTWGDIADAIRALPPIASNVPFPTLYQRAAIQLIQQEALVLRGERSGLQNDPIMRRRMQNGSDQAMANEVLRL